MRSDPASTDLSTAAALAELARSEQAQRWQAGERVLAESYFERFSALASDRESALDVIYGECLLREAAGERPSLEEFCRRFPQWSTELTRLFEVHTALDLQDRSADSAAGEMPCGTAGVTSHAAASGLPAGYVLGGYQVQAELGRGGMGVVYRARQTALSRDVAVKLLFDSADPDQRRRFQSEAEAVAQLQHPHIVQIFEVGRCEDRPYLAMELVEGGTLADKIAGAPTSARDAAEMGRTLALAVQAAHERGIVHRDLKPANVLLDRQGTPKIADFGLAKQLEGASTQTRTGSLLGTPGYMAPEQVRGRGSDIGPPADVYALGAVIYEMLTGNPPFRSETALDTLMRVLADEPLPPSRLVPTVPRDLETIALHCLEKQPHRRYADAAALAEDLRRFLAGEPIVARPSGRLERAWKWASRHPAAAVAWVSIGALALVSTVLSALFAHQRNLALDAARVADVRTHEAKQDKQRADREKAAAQRQARKAANVQEFVLQMLAAVDPATARGRDVTVRELLDPAGAKARTDLASEPEVLAAVLDTIGQMYAMLGRREEALRELREALDIRRQTLSPTNLDVALSADHTFRALIDLGPYSDDERREALRLCSDAYEARRLSLGEHHPLTVELLGYRARLEGEIGQGKSSARSLADVGRSISSNALLPKNLDEKFDEIRTLWLAERRDQAMTVMLDAVAPFRQRLGNTVAIGHAARYLAQQRREAGDWVTAEAIYHGALRVYADAEGPDGPNTMVTLARLGLTLNAQRKFDEAIPILERSIALGGTLYPEGHVELGNAHWELGEAHWHRHEAALAQTSARRACDVYSAAQATSRRAEAAERLAWCAALAGQQDEAESQLREALALASKEPPRSRARILRSLASFLLLWHPRPQQVKAEAQQLAEDSLRSAPDAKSSWQIVALANLRNDRRSEASVALARAHRVPGGEPFDMLLAAILAHQQQEPAAAELYRRVEVRWPNIDRFEVDPRELRELEMLKRELDALAAAGHR